MLLNIHSNTKKTLQELKHLAGCCEECSFHCALCHTIQYTTVVVTMFTLYIRNNRHSRDDDSTTNIVLLLPIQDSGVHHKEIKRTPKQSQSTSLTVDSFCRLAV